MAETSRPRVDWTEIVDFIHVLFNAVVVRNHYPDRHPAIGRADDHAVKTFARMQDRASEIVIALVDGEFVVMERPMPDLRRRVPGFAEAMQRHRIECLVFTAGLDRADIAALAQGLNGPAAPEGQEAAARERLQSRLKHVLLRFVEAKGIDASQRAVAENAAQLEPAVRDLLARVKEWIEKSLPFEHAAVRAVAEQILWCVRAKAYALVQHSWAPGLDLSAGHATNVAIVAGAMANEAGLRSEAAIDVIAGAILHDVGQLLLPSAIRHVPEPILDDRGRRFHRYHPFLGARALFEAGCPAPWVAIALEHHRGVDGEGFPGLDDKPTPHEASRLVAIANFFDRKRTSLTAPCDPPEAIVRQMRALAGRYFDARYVELFLRAVGVFPAGSTVQLTDYRTAVVTRAVASDPLRPDVRMLFGEDVDTRVSLLDYEVREERHALSILRAVPPPPVLVPRAEAEALVGADALVPSRPEVPPRASSLPPRRTPPVLPGGLTLAPPASPSAPAPQPIAPSTAPVPMPSGRAQPPRTAPAPPQPTTPSARPRHKPIPREDPDE